jgi:hypothetical protein
MSSSMFSSAAVFDRPSAADDDSTLGIAIGAAVGGLVLLGIIGAVLFFVCRAKNKTPPTSVASVASVAPPNSEYGVLPPGKLYDDVADVHAQPNGIYDAPDSTLVI